MKYVHTSSSLGIYVSDQLHETSYIYLHMHIHIYFSQWKFLLFSLIYLRLKSFTRKNIDFKNSFHFLPFNTYPEYNKACITYTFFPLKIFPYLSPHSISASFVLHISKCTLHFHVASPFATPFEPSRSFYFVRLYRSFPPYIGLWNDGSIVRCPGYNPIRLELDRDNRDGPRVVANGVATIPRTALDRSFIFTPGNAIPTPPPPDSLKPATTGLSPSDNVEKIP